MPEPGRVDPRWVGLVVAAAGLVPIAGAVFADDAGFGAPRWLVATIGAVFLAAGLLLVSRRGAAPGDDLGSALLGAIVTSGLAIPFAWLLLFTSREEWHGSGFPLGWLPDWIEDAFFYGLLGTVTLGAVVLAVFAWRDFLRRLGSRLPTPLGAALSWTAALLLLGFMTWQGYGLFGPPAGPREPLVHLAFDGTLDDGGPAGARAAAHGDEVAFHPGVVGRAAFVGGSEDWLDYALPEGLDLGGSLSLELWFRREDWVNPYRAGSGVQTLAAVGPLSVGLDLTRAAGVDGTSFRLAARAGRARVVDRSRSVPPATWTHVAVVYDQSWHALRLYVDGRQAGRGAVAIAPALGPERMLRLGTWYRSNQAFRGAVDEVRLYTRALTEDEVRASAARRR